jgi:hypothetical protein
LDLSAYWAANALGVLPYVAELAARATGVIIGILGVSGAMLATPAGQQQISALFYRIVPFPRGRG